MKKKYLNIFIDIQYFDTKNPNGDVLLSSGGAPFGDEDIYIGDMPLNGDLFSQ